MTTLFNSFRTIHTFVVSGTQQSGKLTFALYLANLVSNKQPITIVSPDSIETLMEHAKLSIKNCYPLKTALDKTNFIQLNEKFKNNNEVGNHLRLLEKLEKIIQHTGCIVIFHRVEELFETQDIKHIDNLLFKLTSNALAENKKFIFTYNVTNSHSVHFHQYLNKNTDLEFQISKNFYHSNSRNIKFISSLFTSSYTDYIFRFDTTHSAFDLSPNISQFNPLNQKKIILLASENNSLIGIIRYLFNHYDFIIKCVTPSLKEISQAIHKHPALVILNPSKNQAMPELKKIGQLMHNHSFPALFISTRSELRRRDKMEIAQHGFSEIHTNNFHIEDLIMSIERLLNIPFYNTEIQKLPNKTYVLHDQKTFNRIIVSFLCKNIFFTVFKFKFNGEALSSESEIKNCLGRAFDVALVNKDDRLVYFFLVNTLTSDASLIKSRFQQLIPSLSLIGSKDAIKYNIDFHNR